MSYLNPRGFGDATAAQLAGQAGGIAAPLVGTLAGPAAGAAIGVAASVAIPIVGAAFAGLVLGIQAILNSGCGQTCVVTSQWANQASAKLDQLIAAYFALPTPRSQTAQQLYLQAFHAVWNTLVQQCSQPGTGTAGQNCIQDRQDGACKWKALPPAYPGEPNAGECWNWWNAYYYPVANDPNVVPDSQLQAAGVSTQLANAAGVTPSGSVADTSGGSVAEVGGIPWWGWALGAAAVVWAVN